MSFLPKAKFVSGSPLMVDYTPVSAVNAGDVLVILGKLAIVHVDIAANILGAVSLGRAVYDVLCDTTVAYAATSIVYYDTTNSFATASTSNTIVLGTPLAAQASGSTATYIRTIVGPLRSVASL